MRIAIAATQVPFVTGGAEHLQGELQRALQSAGHEASIISMPFEYGPPPTILKSMLCWEVQDWNHAAGFADLVICTRFPSFYLRHPNKVVWLFHQHRAAYDLYSETDSSMSAELRAEIQRNDTAHLRQAVKLCTISRRVRSRLWSYNQIESTPVYPPPPLAGRVQTAPSEPFVFMPSRIEPLKRQELLIRAMRFVRSPIRAVICGDGTDAHSCRKLIQDLGLNGQIDFLGHISVDRLLSNYARCLAVIFPPHDEDLGLVTLEAMLARKPVVSCADSGGPLEFVQHNKTGLVVNAEPKQLAIAIDDLYFNRQWAREMGEAGYRVYLNAGISWDRVLNHLIPDADSRMTSGEIRSELALQAPPVHAPVPAGGDMSPVDFAREAYRRILGREIEATAMSSVLRGLAMGRARTDILLDLAMSEESRQRLLNRAPASRCSVSAGFDAAPAYLQVESTTRCNARCSYCRRTLGTGPPTGPPRDLPEELWPEILQFSTRVGYVRLHGFGEPLCCPELLTKMRALDDLGVSTCFSTNGTNLADFVDELAGLKHLLHVNVSIDSPDPFTYRQIRQADLAQVSSALALLVQRLPETNISVSSVATVETLPTLCQFPEFLRKVEIRTLIVQPLNDPAGRLVDLSVHRQSDAPQVFARLREECGSAGIALDIGPTLEQELLDWQAMGERTDAQVLSRQCNCPFDSLFIDSAGKVFPCCLAVDGPPLGDMRLESLDEIWHGAALRAFRQQLLSATAPDICRKCPNAPQGEHPLSRFGCSVVSLVVAGCGRLGIQLQVRNTGSAAWDHQTPLRVGTAHPRDRCSPGRLSSWVAPNRPCNMKESYVPPGEVATFSFGIDATACLARESFQLVAEGKAWIPGTEFFLDFRGEGLVGTKEAITCLPS